MSSQPDQTPFDGAGDVTRLLSASSGGDDGARDRLVELVYAEIHRMAQGQMRGERAEHTLGATGLVHETFLKLFRVAPGDAGLVWHDRRAFFAAAATAMRRVLVDHARARKAEKRGGGARRTDFEADALAAAATMEASEFLSLDEAISRLEGVDPRASEVVRLRFYSGLEIKEVAELLNVSDRTIRRDWEFARAWLFASLNADDLAEAES